MTHFTRFRKNRVHAQAWQAAQADWLMHGGRL